MVHTKVVCNGSPLRVLRACGQILQKNPGKGQTPPHPCLYFGSFWNGTPSLRLLMRSSFTLRSCLLVHLKEQSVHACLYSSIWIRMGILKVLVEQIIYVALLYFVKGVVVFSVVIDWLPNKDAFLAGVVVFPFMMDFYVLLHHTVLARLEWAPGANTPERKIYYQHYSL